MDRVTRTRFSPEQHRLFRQAEQVITSMSLDRVALAAAPALNDLGVIESVRWSGASSSRDFAISIRGHAFTHDGSSVVLKPRFRRVLAAIVMTSPPSRAPDIVAAYCFRAVAASFFMQQAEANFTTGPEKIIPARASPRD